MVMPTWPGGLPEFSREYSLQNKAPGIRRTKMNAGNVRQRQLYYSNDDHVNVRLELTMNQFMVFEYFAKVATRGGWFRGHIWDSRGRVNKTVRIIGNNYKAVPLGVTHWAVDFALEVDNRAFADGFNAQYVIFIASLQEYTEDDSLLIYNWIKNAFDTTTLWD